MNWLIYGANGYTGRLIAARAKERGHQPVLAGRNPQRLLDMSRELELPARIFDLRHPETIRTQLQGIKLVLNAAGPFSQTARALVQACMAQGAAYLDITGEIEVFESLHRMDDALRAAGVVAIPGVGFDVVPSDSLAAMLKERLPDASHLSLAFMNRGGSLSPGTAKTAVEGAGLGGRIRRDGALVSVPVAHETRRIPFPGGDALAVSIPWGDVATAYYATGIPNITVYAGIEPGARRWLKMTAPLSPLLKLPPTRRLLTRLIERRVHGPSPAARQRAHTVLWGEARNGHGTRVTLGMRTPEGYTLTAEAAVRAVEKVLERPPPAGYHTPSQAFGVRFVLEIPGVEMLPVVEDREEMAT